MDTVPVPELLKDLSRHFTARGYQVYLVGGAVRDLFLGKKPDDWDIATDATPAQVASLFRRIIPTGIEHGTVTIPFREHHIECTTFRTEQGYSDGRRPDSISYAATIEEDLSRRDFTMNAIAVSLPEGSVIDPFSGRADIGRRLIRTVGSAAERFSEDGLRPLRAVRFSSQLAFTMEQSTLEAIRPALPVTARVALERVREELVKILASPVPSTALKSMEATGLLQLILPELQSCRGIEQKGMHRYDVLDHLLLTCDACPADIPELRLAGLFHDIGKPCVRSTDADGEYTFYNHESVSAEMTEELMERLRFPMKLTRAVSHLVRQHMFHYESNWSDAAVRRFLVRTGEDSLSNLFLLRLADASAITGLPAGPLLLSDFQDHIDRVLAQKHAFSLKDLKVNGRDLMSIGIPSGPHTGQILNELMETVLDDPELNERDRLISIAGEIYKTRYGGLMDQTLRNATGRTPASFQA